MEKVPCERVSTGRTGMAELITDQGRPKCGARGEIKGGRAWLFSRAQESRDVRIAESWGARPGPLR